MSRGLGFGCYRSGGSRPEPAVDRTAQYIAARLPLRWWPSPASVGGNARNPAGVRCLHNDPWLTLEQALGLLACVWRRCAVVYRRPGSEFVRACFHVKRIPYSLNDARDADRGLTSIRR